VAQASSLHEFEDFRAKLNPLRAFFAARYNRRA